MTCELIGSKGLSSREIAEGYVFSRIESWPKILTGPCNSTVCLVNSECSVINGKAECVRSECPEPPMVEGATVAEGQRGIGDTRNYTCDIGLWSESSMVAECSEEGTWVRPNGACIQVSCGQPEALPNTDYRVWSSVSTICEKSGTVDQANDSCRMSEEESADEIPYLSIVEYICQDGTIVTVSMTSTCLANGTWSYTEVVCYDIDECVYPNNCTDPDSGEFVTGVVGCVNGQGSYTCTCGAGYENTEDQTICTDIDECEYPNNCTDPDSGTFVTGVVGCVNIQGSYTCTCGAGYENTENPTICTDINECKYPNNCTDPDSGEFVTGVVGCENIEGSYTCTCGAGYENTEDQTICTDIDECEYPNNCTDPDSGKFVTGVIGCVNGQGSYTCMCGAGYENTENPTICTDIDECEYPNNCTDPDSGEFVSGVVECVNIQGSYTCTCAAGYENTENPTICTDIGDCEFPNSCTDPSGIHFVTGVVGCVASLGSYKCTCGTGYENTEDQTICTDIDECEYPNNCTDPGSGEFVTGVVGCVNIQGSYTCTCGAGYENTENQTICTGKVILCRHDSWNSPIREENLSTIKCAVLFRCISRSFPLVKSVQFIFFSDIDECEYSNNCTDPGSGTFVPGVVGCVNNQGSYTCTCETGYENTEDQTICTDIDECEHPNNCTDHDSGEFVPGVIGCVNNEGGYTCTCETGYENTEDPIICTAIIPCDMHNEKKQILGRKFLVFQCPHPVSTSSILVLIRECGGFGTGVVGCVNSQGSYTCTCGAGYGNTENPTICTDINECNYPNNCTDLGSGEFVTGVVGCVNNQGSYTCTCGAGYGNTEDQTICTDIDDCEYPNSCTDPSGIHYVPGVIGCVASLGSYKCTCATGYENKKIRQSAQSVQFIFHSDIDECEYPNNCTDPDSGEFVTGVVGCVNSQGSYTCTCGAGYENTEDPTICTDIDECEHPNNCTDPDSGEFVTGVVGCVNNQGSYTCTCGAGYENTEDQTVCTDIGDCEFPNICTDPGGIHFVPGVVGCVASLGWYKCTCATGYENTEDQTICTDIDECEYPNNCTDPNSGTFVTGVVGCVNNQGSYTCTCGAGYENTENQTICTDIDECEYPNNCTDPDSGECVTGVVGCVNIQGSCTCLCGAGYENTEDQTICTDIDECAYPNNCTDPDSGGFVTGVVGCVNSQGSYTCTCGAGYENTENQPFAQHFPLKKSVQFFLHSDIDECEYPNNCTDPDSGEFVTGVVGCVNSQGSYTCTCGAGYENTENQTICTDIDECESPNNCKDPDNGEFVTGVVGCVNNQGSYTCTCGAGYENTENQTICTDIDECEYPNNCTDPSSWTFVPGVVGCVNSQGSYTCTCGAGYEYTENQTICTDINECEHPNNCTDPDSGEFVPGVIGCVNNKGAYTCTCETGYENTEDPIICTGKVSFGGFVTGVVGCVNSQGSYTCTCGAGYGNTENPTICTDIDDCEYPNSCTDPGGKYFVTGVVGCVASLGSYKCTCATGYENRKASTICRDINECNYPNNCTDLGSGEFVTGVVGCVNNQGSYTCACGAGYGNTEDQTICTDIDDCEYPNSCTDPSGIHYVPGAIGCVASLGSYKCMCGTGYENTNDSTICTDIDECEYPNNCTDPGSGEFVTGVVGCVNIQGSYTCTCGAGYGNTENPTICTFVFYSDIDECEYPNNCTDPGSGEFVTGVVGCVNSHGSYTCTCGAGYENTEDQTICTGKVFVCCFFSISKCFMKSRKCFVKSVQFIFNSDIDECAYPNNCTDPAIGTFVSGVVGCVNSQGSYTCTCGAGYENTENLTICTDIDECEYPNNCTDPDSGECVTGVVGCVNIQGSCTCLCGAGYENTEDQTICTDIDECAYPNNCTDPDSGGFVTGVVGCVNSQGSYTCTCGAGYENTENQTICTDIDECEYPNNCTDPNSGTFVTGVVGCVNIQGSYTCTCGAGYENTEDQTICTDIDDCEYPNSCTDPDGKHFVTGVVGCVASLGSYKCTCATGYENTKVSSICTDIDECDYPNNCIDPSSGEFVPGVVGCVNNQGSYTCTCGAGYENTEDQTICTDIDECEYPNNCTDPDSGEFVPGVVGCVNSQASYTCTCGAGYENTEDQTICTDINECEYLHNCTDPAIGKFVTGVVGCVNSQGSYTCTCGAGYGNTEDQTICTDIDECAYPNNCTDPDSGEFVTGVIGCMNIQGSYTCTCGAGYENTEDHTICTDIDECENPNNCKDPDSGTFVTGVAGCVNIQGSYTCTCGAGYENTENQTICTDIDECEHPNNCSDPDSGEFVPGVNGCVNNEGAYTCTCETGYENTEDPIICTATKNCSLYFGPFITDGLCEKWYYYHDVPGTYLYNAKVGCSRELLKVKSTNEDIYITDWLDRCSNQESVFIQGYVDPDGTYYYRNGRTAIYTNWDSGQPEVDSSGRLNVVYRKNDEGRYMWTTNPLERGPAGFVTVEPSYADCKKVKRQYFKGQMTTQHQDRYIDQSALSNQACNDRQVPGPYADRAPTGCLGESYMETCFSLRKHEWTTMI
ncbi:hypothetical protein ScPMuIL_005069 [Solemya velum]